MHIAVIGTGYVGLVTGVALAQSGKHRVKCFDVDREKLKRLADGDPVIVEAELKEHMRGAMQAGSLSFAHVDVLNGELAHADLILIAVGTPTSEDGVMDVSQVEAVVKQVKAHAHAGAWCVVKSTVPPGTVRRLTDAAPTVGDVNFAFAPEFLREGTAWHDTFHADRFVLGVDSNDEDAIDLIVNTLNLARASVHVMRTREAELVKFLANAMLATRITWANAVADFCEREGGDAHRVLAAVGADSRIGPHFLLPGPGFGGSCFSKDLPALLHDASPQLAALVALTLDNNDLDLAWAERVLYAERVSADATIAVRGLAFKAGTDDVRGSSALVLVRWLISRGYPVRLWDVEPRARENFERALGDLASPERTQWAGHFDGCDALVLFHGTASDVELVRSAKQLPALIVDTRACLRRVMFGPSTHVVMRGVGMHETYEPADRPRGNGRTRVLLP